MRSVIDADGILDQGIAEQLEQWRDLEAEDLDSKDEGKHLVKAELWEAFATVMSRARKDITYSPVDSDSRDMYVWGQSDLYIERKIREACDLAFEQSIEEAKSGVEEPGHPEDK